MKWGVWLVVGLVASAMAGPAKANLIVNGGFETGNFSGWTLSGNTHDTGVVGPGFDDGFVDDPHSGNFFAVLGPEKHNGFLSQTFADTAGQSLVVEFFLANDGATPNDFSVSFDSTTLLSLTNDGAHGYTDYVFDVTGTGSDTLTIGGFRNDPGFFALDDVSVNPTSSDPPSSVPEPASLALFGVGLLGFGLLRRRRAS